jgi:hypothetical protein
VARQKHYINSFVVKGLGANASDQGTPIEMPRDSFDIEIDQISVTSIRGGAIVAPNFVMQLTEQGGSNRTLFIQPQHARNLVGDGSMPWQLIEPWVVPGSSRIVLDVTSTDASAQDLYVMVSGRRVKPVPSED